jgi:hypothetical protein
VKPAKPQPDLFERNAGTFLRDQGMERATQHADRVSAAWSHLAYEGLLAYVKQRPTSMPFTTEDVRAAVRIAEPPDRRAWGAVVARAARAGVIRRVGYRQHSDPIRHRGISTVWEPKRAVGKP